jgi:hypothetical protein
MRSSVCKSHRISLRSVCLVFCVWQTFTESHGLHAEDQIDRIRNPNLGEVESMLENPSNDAMKSFRPRNSIKAPIFWARFGLYPRNSTRALLLASSIGSPTSIARFLEHGADIEGRGRDDETPLIAAAGRGHLAATALLLASGANPRAVNRAGQSALDKATARRDAAGRATCALLRRRLLELEPPPPPPPERDCRTPPNTLARRALRATAVAAGSLLFGWAVAAAGLFATGQFDPWLLEH